MPEHILAQLGRMLFVCGVLCMSHWFVYFIYQYLYRKKWGVERIKRLLLMFLLGFSSYFWIFLVAVVMMSGGYDSELGLLQVFDGFFDGLCQTLWAYSQSSGDGYSLFYRWLNIIEGTFWVIFGVLVIVRYVKNRHSIIELGYALAFLIFGYSDYHEAVIVQPWLILLKGYVLVMLLWLRKIVIRRFYPESKTY